MMGTKTMFLSAMAALAATVVAQTPGGFTPNKQQTMGVTFGSNTVSPAGELLTQTETANAPSISSIQLGQSTTGLIMMIDIDAGSSSNRQPRLHWLATGVTPDLSSPNAATLNIPSSGASSVPYAGPMPPAGDTPHRYVLLLFTQPTSFSIPSSYGNGNLASNRGNFNYQQFITDLRLGDPLAANYFTVQNTGSGGSSSSSSSGSSSATSSSASGSSSGSMTATSSRASGTGSATGSATGGVVTQSASAGDAAVIVNGKVVAGMAAAGLMALL